MREAMRTLNDGRGREELLLKIGIHEGPCLAVVLNDRQDYFGTTVNIAARVQAPQENGGNVTRPRVADDFSTIRARNARDPRSRAQRRLDTLLQRRQRP